MFMNIYLQVSLSLCLPAQLSRCPSKRPSAHSAACQDTCRSCTVSFSVGIQSIPKAEDGARFYKFLFQSLFKFV